VGELLSFEFKLIEIQ